MNKSSRRGVVALWDERTHLLLGVTVAAHSPQVLESSPQEDDEETPKESDHGRGEESPPHPLAVAVTGHIWRERDDHAHLGYVDGRVRVEFIPVFRHYRSLVTWPAPAHNNQKKERKKERKKKTRPGWGGRGSGALGSSSQRPLTPQRLSHVLSQPPPAPRCLLIWLLRAVWKVEWNSETRAQLNMYFF